MVEDRKSQIDALLTNFGQSLKASDEFYHEGTQLAQRLFIKLQQKSKFSIAEPHFGGSFGKKTDVMEPDLDLVVVCNEVEPPLAKVLDDFEDVLTLYQDELRINSDSIKNKERSINFYFKNGIEVDLLPAANIEDKEEVIQKIMKDPRNSVYYSPSLVKTQVGFLKSQESFTHTLIRLAKYWYKNLYFGGEKVFGGSAMIELISVAAAEEEGKSMLRAFDKVLEMISRLDSLKLAFRSLSADNDKWERVPVNELHQGNSRQIVPCLVGNPLKLQQNYFIIEPANPFQDFLEERTITVINNFKKFASLTRTDLGQLVSSNRVGEDFILALFQPRPLVIVHVHTLCLPNYFNVKYASPCSSLLCGMKVRNEAVMKDDRKKATIDVLKARLLSVVNAVATTNPDTVTTNSVCDAVRDATKTSLQVDLGPAAVDRENEMDVTLTIPYRIKGQGYAVRYSMSWK
ncbi:unnamed protein product [Orchesella dallaii]|uniref:2'-5'-oligoadenylate synthetase 1 domain-containing protein n=1 Tax=Orchesella dallaii TaxID=48710 RepID=A0ABP1S7H8_9HEXA